MRKQKMSYKTNMPLAVQLRENLKKIVIDPIKLIDSYFDPKPPCKPLLTIEDFRDLTTKLLKNFSKLSKISVEIKEIDNLFFYLDTQRSGQVSLTNFKNGMFDEKEMAEVRSKTTLRFSQKMNEEIE